MSGVSVVDAWLTPWENRRRDKKQSARWAHSQNGVIGYRLAGFDKLPSSVNIHTAGIARDRIQKLSHDFVVIQDTGQGKIQIMV
jgi:hypothetical protein